MNLLIVTVFFITLFVYLIRNLFQKKNNVCCPVFSQLEIDKTDQEFWQISNMYLEQSARVQELLKKEREGKPIKNNKGFSKNFKREFREAFRLDLKQRALSELCVFMHKSNEAILGGEKTIEDVIAEYENKFPISPYGIDVEEEVEKGFKEWEKKSHWAY